MIRNVGLTLLVAFMSLAATPYSAGAQTVTPDGLPKQLRSCNVFPWGSNCTVWTLDGDHYNAHWPNGAVSMLTVERFDKNGVIIHRLDTGGPLSGLKALYTGTWDGRQIVNGQFVRPDTKNTTYQWTASAVEAGEISQAASTASPSAVALSSEDTVVKRGRVTEGIPTVMHICALYCGTWTLRDGRYYVSGAAPVTVPIITVERFEPDAVVFNRADPTPSGSIPFTGVYRGKMVSGDSIRAGTVIFTTQGASHALSFTAAWGNALNSIRGAGSPSCDVKRDAASATEVAFPRGKSAANTNDSGTAACWFHVAALHGDARSALLYAIYLYQGNGVQKNYTQAFDWAKKSASAGDVFGEQMVAELYKEGKGTTKDPRQAEYWTRKASSAIAAEASAERRAAMERAQMNMALSMSLLKLLFTPVHYDLDSSHCQTEREDNDLYGQHIDDDCKTW